MSKVTEAQARKVLKQINDKLNPVFEGERFYTEPTLSLDWDGHVAILWEEGPDDWAFHLDGSPSESDYELYEQMNQEFGGNLKPKTRKAVEFPKGVYGEPFYSFVLCLYPS